MPVATINITEIIEPGEGTATGDAAEQARVAELIAGVKKVIDPTSWDSVGGSDGAIASHFTKRSSDGKPKWLLVVRQTDANITAIRGIVQDLD